MNEIKRMISDFEAAVTQYNTHISYAEGEWREKLMFRRRLDLCINADLRQQLMSGTIARRS